MKWIQPYSLFESQFEPLQYSGGDVTSMPVIGKVITKPIGPFESGEYDIVEIIDTPRWSNLRDQSLVQREKKDSPIDPQ